MKSSNDLVAELLHGHRISEKASVSTGVRGYKTQHKPLLTAGQKKRLL